MVIKQKCIQAPENPSVEIDRTKKNAAQTDPFPQGLIKTLFGRKVSSDFGPSVPDFSYEGAADLISTSRGEEHSERNTKADSRSKTDRITHDVVLWPNNRLPRAIREALQPDLLPASDLVPSLCPTAPRNTVRF